MILQRWKALRNDDSLGSGQAKSHLDIAFMIADEDKAHSVSHIPTCLVPSPGEVNISANLVYLCMVSDSARP